MNIQLINQIPLSTLRPIEDVGTFVKGSTFVCNEGNLNRFEVWEAIGDDSKRITIKAEKLAVSFKGGFTTFIMGYPAKAEGTTNPVDSVYVSKATLEILKKIVTPALFVPRARNELVSSALAEAVRHEVPSSEACQTMFNNISQNNAMRGLKYPIAPATSEIELIMIMTPFAIFDDFQDTMEDYFRNPDIGVVPKTITAQEVANKVDILVNGAARRPQDAIRADLGENVLYTEHEWKVIAYCMLICFSKSGEQANIETALNARTKSLSFALFLRLKEQFASSMINCMDLNRVSAKLVEYPVLKSHLARLLLSDSSAFGVHARKILEGSSLSMFTLILSFLSAPCPTKLHLVRPVLMEIKSFFEAKKELINKYGDGWKFHKVFFPDEQLGSTTAYPNLQNAAQVWGVSSGTTAGAANILIKNRIGEQATQRLRELAAQPLPNNWVANGLTKADFLTLVEGCQININVDNISDDEWFELMN